MVLSYKHSKLLIFLALQGSCMCSDMAVDLGCLFLSSEACPPSSKEVGLETGLDKMTVPGR